MEIGTQKLQAQPAVASVKNPDSPLPAVYKGDYDEFTNFAVSAYADKDVVRSLVKVLKDRFWGFIIELDDERRKALMATFAENNDLIAPLFQTARTTLFVQSLLKLPESFEQLLRNGFIEEAGKLTPGDPARIRLARVFASGKFLDSNELRTLAQKAKDEEIESLLSSLNAQQIAEFVKVLGADRLEKLPTIIKRATVLAQVKSVICADTVTDPKLKQVCNSGKWATVRTFGVKK